jgi:signal transduction histidine kinase/ActR/RegA family two-component response regulator
MTATQPTAPTPIPATARARSWFAGLVACAALAAFAGLAAIESGGAAIDAVRGHGIRAIADLQTIARVYAVEAPAALEGAASGRIGQNAAGFALREARETAAAAWARHKAGLPAATEAERVFAAELELLLLRADGALDQAVVLLGTRDGAAIRTLVAGELSARAEPLRVGLLRASDLRRAALDRQFDAAAATRRALLAALIVFALAGAFCAVRLHAAWRAEIDEPLARLARAADELADAPPAPGRSALAGLAHAHDALRAARAAREEATRTAQAARRAKSLFLTAMSHRIRTPMHGILGLVEAHAGGEMAPERRATLRTVRQSAENLLAVVDDLMDYARIDADSIAVDRRATDAGDLLEQAALNLAGLAEAKGLALSCFVDPAIVERFKIDPLRVRQVLFNLIGNAIGQTQTGYVHARLSLAEGMLVFAVEDSGAALSAETVAMLLDPKLESADGLGAFRAGAAGLGLPVCRALAERMGGRMRVRARDTGGTVFALELPAEPAGGGLRPLPAGDALKGRRARVLGASGPAHATVAAYLIAADASIVAERDPADLAVALPDAPDFGPPGPKRLRLTALPPVAPPDDAEAGATLLRRSAIVGAAARALGLADEGIEDVDPASLPAREPPAREIAEAQGALILAVDDHPVNRDVVARQLARLGYRADTAASGEEGLAMWRQARYGLVVTDLHMPDLDGFELAKRIRAAETQEGRKRAPIVALTAATGADEVAACYEAGMDGVLAKPLPLRGLADAMRRHLPRV